MPALFNAKLTTTAVANNITNVSRGASETGSASSQVSSSAQSLPRESSHLKTKADNSSTWCAPPERASPHAEGSLDPVGVRAIRSMVACPTANRFRPISVRMNHFQRQALTPGSNLWACRCAFCCCCC
jgi:hypothetical protein